MFLFENESVELSADPNLTQIKPCSVTTNNNTAAKIVENPEISQLLIIQQA